MAWFVLIVAGLFEAGWSLGLNSTEGFARPLPSLLTGAAIVVSLVLLARAAQTLPIGTAYAVWVGSGSVKARHGCFLWRRVELAGGATLLGVLAARIPSRARQ